MNTRLLSGIQLRQLMPTSWNASSRGLWPCVLTVSFLKSITTILLLWRNQNFTLCVWGGITSMHSFLFKFALVLNSVLLFWKLLAFEFLLGTSETSLCSVSAPQVNNVPLTDALQLLMLFAGTLMNLEPKTFSLIIFYNGPCIILTHYLYATCVYVCKYASFLAA
jgi:hypothetical protein